MKYQIGDIVTFDIPSPREENRSDPKRRSRSGSQRFGIGTITTLLEEKEAYQITGLNGGKYTVPEGHIGGKTDFVKTSPT
jgi:hypothetical protein